MSNKYVSDKSKLQFKCEFGHIWYTTFRKILGGNWCSECSRISKSNSIDDANKLAKSNRGLCLSKEYVNNTTKMKWRCSKGHIWSATYKDIRDGCWCPTCNRPGKRQKEIAKMISDILCLSVEQNFTGFDWLRTKSGKQEIDIWVPEIKLAIEYDGEQHFKPMRYGTKDKMLNKLFRTQHLDKLKNKKIKEHSEDVKYFIRINYKDKITKEYLTERLKYKGVI